MTLDSTHHLFCHFKATPSHTLVSGHPPACKSESTGDYYHVLIGAQAEILHETEQSEMLTTEQSCIQLLPVLFYFSLA